MATAMIATGTENLVEKKVRKPRATKKVPVEPVPDIEIVVAEPPAKKRKRASSGENQPTKKAKQEEITLESLKEEVSQLQFVFAQYTAANDKLILELQALSGKFTMPLQNWK